MRRGGRLRCDLCGGAGADRVDHVQALAAGGTDDPGNRWTVHTSCVKELERAEGERRRRDNEGGGR